MTADPLQPFRLDLRDTARIEPRGIDQFGSHHPFPRLLQQLRAGPDVEFDRARAQIMRILIGLETDIAQQASEQRGVKLFVSRRHLVQAPALLAHDRQQLRMDVAPLAQPQLRQEVGAAVILQQPVRFLVFDRFVEPLPDFQVTQELRFFIGEFLVRLVRCALGVHRPVARVLYRKRGGDDQHFAQADVIERGQDHAADAWVERQFGELLAERRQQVAVVDCAELLQQLVTVGDRAPRRRFDEREGLNIGQVQRLHAQDDGGQRRTQDLRLGEFRPQQIILFVIQTDADTCRDPAAAAGALIGGRLCDRLDLQLLHLVAIAVALDARQSGIDHIADTGYRQRSLRHVGGEHDAARIGDLEHAFLLLRR